MKVRLRNRRKKKDLGKHGTEGGWPSWNDNTTHEKVSRIDGEYRQVLCYFLNRQVTTWDSADGGTASTFGFPLELQCLATPEVPAAVAVWSCPSLVRLCHGHAFHSISGPERVQLSLMRSSNLPCSESRAPHSKIQWCRRLVLQRKMLSCCTSIT
ncbi:hypothetical protein BC567DRAFT_63196 [Phyllosticta citribraziliensis]